MSFQTLRELFDRMQGLANINYIIGMQTGIETALPCHEDETFTEADMDEETGWD